MVTKLGRSWLGAQKGSTTHAAFIVQLSSDAPSISNSRRSVAAVLYQQDIGARPKALFCIYRNSLCRAERGPFSSCRFCRSAIAIRYVDDTARANPRLGFEHGNDFTRPEMSASSRVEFRKSSSATSTTDRERKIFQYNSKIKLSDDRALGMLIQIPLDEKTTTAFDQPEVENAAGLSDAILQAALIQTVRNRWAYGLGRVSSPRPPTDMVGTNRWQIMPAAGLRYSFLEINPDVCFVPVVRYESVSAVIQTLARFASLKWRRRSTLAYPTIGSRRIIRAMISGLISGRRYPAKAVGSFCLLTRRSERKSPTILSCRSRAACQIVRDYPVYNFKTELKGTWQF
jgi:hypothetical protein